MMRQLVLELAPPSAPTLDDFFPGPNAAVLAALRDAVAGGEQVVYLFGEPGCGKTHLLRAAVREAGARGRPARYVGAPDAGLAALSGVSFAAGEVFAVDGVERLDGAAQLALFEAFHALKAARASLIAAGRSPAADLVLREDLRTRLGSGVSLRLAQLGDEEKAAALTWHAARRGLHIDPDIVRYVLTHCRRDMGTQTAVLDALDRHSLEHKRPVTLPLLREALRSLEP